MLEQAAFLGQLAIENPESDWRRAVNRAVKWWAIDDPSALLFGSSVAANVSSSELI